MLTKYLISAEGKI